MFNVGTQLRKTRKKANLTLDQLAASSGVDRGTISRIELGHVSPRIDTIGFLCEAMDTSLNSFFTQQEAPPPAPSLSPNGRTGSAPPRSAPSGAPSFQEMVRRTPSAFFPDKPALEDYWPVPSSFWRGLLEVLERFEILVKNSQEMILVQDGGGIILYASPPCEEILGLRPHDLVGRNFKALMHPEDQDSYEACLAGLSCRPGASGSLVYRMRRQDDSWCWISGRLTNQLANPNIQAVVVNALKMP